MLSQRKLIVLLLVILVVALLVGSVLMLTGDHDNADIMVDTSVEEVRPERIADVLTLVKEYDDQHMREIPKMNSVSRERAHVKSMAVFHVMAALYRSLTTAERIQFKEEVDSGGIALPIGVIVGPYASTFLVGEDSGADDNIREDFQYFLARSYAGEAHENYLKLFSILEEDRASIRKDVYDSYIDPPRELVTKQLLGNLYPE